MDVRSDTTTKVCNVVIGIDFAFLKGQHSCGSISISFSVNN